jgi:hypothetical protein
MTDPIKYFILDSLPCTLQQLTTAATNAGYGGCRLIETIQTMAGEGVIYIDINTHNTRVTMAGGFIKTM